MNPNVIGLVFAVLLAGTAAAVLTLMADIARDTPQGGRTAVPVMTYAGSASPVPPAPRREAVPARSTGRHRKR